MDDPFFASLATGSCSMPAIRSCSKWALAAALLAVLCMNVCWWLFGQQQPTASPLRIIGGAVCVFWLPGLLLGECLGFRSRHPLETLAVGFVLSLTVEILCMLPPFFWHGGIGTWLALVQGISGLLLALVFWRWQRDEPRFLLPLVRLPAGLKSTQWRSLLVCAAPFALAALAYGWGEDLFDLDGEKLLHMSFVRMYHDLPLRLSDLGIDRNLPPPNLVNIWEFLIAAWARLTGTEPLAVFFRSRAVIPVLGLSGMYLLIQSIFGSRRKSEVLLAGVICACIGGFVLRSPSLAWITAQDATRGVMQFLGSTHHADSAMDVLLTPAMAAGLLVFRRATPRYVLLWATTLAATFLWHPREFLQLALYVGVFGLLILAMPSMRRWRAARNWLVATATMVAAAVMFLGLSAWLVSKESHGYDEMAIKKAAVRYALLPENVLGGRNLFHFPFHLGLSGAHSPEQIMSWQEVDQRLVTPAWQSDGWLLASALAMAVLCLLGERRDRRLGTYYFVFWFVALCWNFSMLLILALTYSEFYMTSPRLLYLLAYLTIMAGLRIVAGRLQDFFIHCRHWLATRRGRQLGPVAAAGPAAAWATAAVCGLAGWGLKAWHPELVPGHSLLYWVTVVLSGMMVAGVLVAVFWRDRTGSRPAARRVFVGALPLAAFFLVPAYDGVRGDIRSGRWSPRGEIHWNESGNPFGFSSELIAAVRALGPGQRILAYPYDANYLDAYAPHYMAISMVNTVVRDLEVRREIAAGRHVLLPPPKAVGGLSTQPRRVDHAAARAWLRRQRVDYVLVNRAHYDGYLRSYLLEHADEYRIVIDRPRTRELFVKCLDANEQRNEAALVRAPTATGR
jgi:hypothetical protein